MIRGIRKLPHWAVASKQPGFYDTESATAIDMTAKIYYKIQELIEHYNNWVDNTNQLIDEFTSSTNQDIETFKIALRQEFQDFIDVVDLKLASQDKDIQDAIDYMKANLTQTIINIINNMESNGELDEAILHALASSLTIQETYIPETEELLLTNALTDVVLYDEATESVTIVEGNFAGKEDRINKVQEISENVSTETYPSTQAVATFVNEKVKSEIDGSVLDALGGEY